MIDLKKLVRTSKALQFLFSFFSCLVKDFSAAGCQKSAAALTYMTLFALVPSMTVAYFFFSLVPSSDGVAEQLQNLIFSNFIPESGREVQTYLQEFSSQARNLTAFGTLMLVVTAYLMLTNIEKTFNTIWGVQQARRGVFSFLLYWAVLTIGPILLLAAFFISTYVLSLNLLVDELDSMGVKPLFFRLIAWLMTAGAFTLLFVAVPNCRVSFKYAAFGGLSTAACFELTKYAFGNLVANANFELIYGAFAVVPLFLIWINVLWTIILAGAVLVRVLAEKRFRQQDEGLSQIDAALICLKLLFIASQKGTGVSDRDFYLNGLSAGQWQRLRVALESNNWVVNSGNGLYVLSRDLRTVTLWDMLSILQCDLNSLDATSRISSDMEFSSFGALKHDALQNLRSKFNVDIETLLLNKS